MTEQSLERFYNLLPTLYRQRDLRNGEQLRALMSVLESEFRVIEADMEAMYDNWFIQTCDSWVIPYIADLAGIRGLSQQKHVFSTQRRLVADTIGYRRRKGTLSVIEHVLKDVTGWYAYAVEFFQHVAVSQHVGHAHAQARGTIDLRRLTALAELNGPFDQLPHTADIRHIRRKPDRDMEGHTQRENRYNLANLGLFIWRLRSYAMRDSFAYALTGQPPRLAGRQYGRYTFHPLGRDLQLFNQPQMITDISQRIEPAYVPAPLSRATFAADLEEYTIRFGDRPEADQPRNSSYYGPDRGLNIIDLRSKDRVPLKPIALISMDLADWEGGELAAIFESYASATKRAAIDVERGRLVMFPLDTGAAQTDSPTDPAPATGDLRVTYAYGFSAEIGGGSYHRQFGPADPGFAPTVIGVAKGTTVDTLQKALQKWDDYCAEHPGTHGVIRILDNGVYDLADPIMLPAGANLTIIADNGVRPTIGPARMLTVECTRTGSEDPQPRSLQLNGLLIDGGLELALVKDYADSQVARMGRMSVMIEHCTLMPLGIQVQLGQVSGTLQLSIDASIVGPLFVRGESADLTLSNTIVDAGKGTIIGNEQAFAIAADAAGSPGPSLKMQNVTVFGKLHVTELTATDVLFTALVTVDHRGAAGPLLHCYVPTGSRTPALEHCLPGHASALRPVVTSARYGDPAYAQLSQRCPRQIRRGATDGAEIGAFHDLFQSQAEDNIQAALDEYLPYDLHAGIIYVT